MRGGGGEGGVTLKTWQKEEVLFTRRGREPTKLKCQNTEKRKKKPSGFSLGSLQKQTIQKAQNELMFWLFILLLLYIFWLSMSVEYRFDKYFSNEKY